MHAQCSRQPHSQFLYDVPGSGVRLAQRRPAAELKVAEIEARTDRASDQTEGRGLPTHRSEPSARPNHVLHCLWLLAENVRSQGS